MPNGGNGMRLFIPAEVKVRDFYPRLLIALEAVRRGYTVYFGWRFAIEDLAQKQAGSILLARAAEVDDEKYSTMEIFKNIKNNQGAVIVHDVEGGGALVNPILYRRMRIDRRVADYADRILTWTNTENIIVQSACEVDPKKVKTVGNPIFEFSIGNYDSFLSKKRWNEKVEKFTLVNFSVPLSANGKKLHAEMRKKAYGRGYKNGLTADEEMQCEEGIQKHISANEEILERVRDEAAINNNIFAMRAHPVDWKTWCGEYEATQIINAASGNVLPWIFASSAVLHHRCTTGIQAALMGIPALSLSREGRLESSIYDHLSDYEVQNKHDFDNISTPNDAKRREIQKQKINLAKWDLGGLGAQTATDLIMDEIDCTLVELGILRASLPEVFEGKSFQEGGVRKKLKSFIFGSRDWTSAREVNMTIRELSPCADRIICSDAGQGVVCIKLKNK